MHMEQFEGKHLHDYNITLETKYFFQYPIRRLNSIEVLPHYCGTKLCNNLQKRQRIHKRL